MNERQEPIHDHRTHMNRREFLGRLAGGALLGAAGLCGNRLQAASNTASWTPPPVLKNPNILVIMVDQMRPPMWMNSSQQAALTQLLPNIVGRLQGSAYNFGEFYVAAAACVPSRSALLTGLYTPQTAMYTTPSDGTQGTTTLNPAYPTWGEAMTVLNTAYNGNVWWFGKWHVSEQMAASPLLPYGFRTRTYPGGTPPYNHSPDGVVNEGSNGGPYLNQVWASDGMIASDFVGWLRGQPPTTGQPSTPWCATVSFVNPHDICYAPAYFQTNPFPPVGLPPKPIIFPPPSGAPPTFYTAQPSPWNYENLSQVPNKPSLQASFVQLVNKNDGVVNDWVLFLNQYMWLQNLVDQQVGAVLDALGSSPFANNTVVIFLSDHGEYGGSHGMHTKAFAAYDESMRVPFSIQFPGQTAPVAMNQMCSAVDFFGLICDLATGGSGQWALAYPDLANRQSLWSFLYNNSSETRVAPAPLGLPYILHTSDEGAGFPYPHITCLRTKLDLNAGAIGAKLAFYANWASCSIYPDGSTPQPEFYDYNPQTVGNTGETGNDYYSNNATTQIAIEQHRQALGTWGPPGTGIIGSELNAPLIGTGTDGNPLSRALTTAQLGYLAFINGLGACSG